MFRGQLLAAWGLALLSCGSAIAVPRSGTDECSLTTAGAVIVTPSCIDSEYATAIIDYESELTVPTSIHLISGYFVNTTTRFNVYLPPKSVWGGRFFQHSYPLNTQNATDDDIGFAAEAGAYVVQVLGQTGYHHEAASAKQSRLIAANYYGVSADSIKGYMFGGSGGSFQVVGAAESTEGVWQGFVPYVLAFPRSIPDANSAIALGGLVLQDVTPSLSDAVLPGGSGDPYAGLSPMQAAVLHETSSNGIPLFAWDALNYTQASQLLRGFWTVIRNFDATYSDDFWSKPGYLGTENSDLGNYLRDHRRIDSVAIAKVDSNTTGYVTSLRVPSLNRQKGLIEQTIVAGDTADWVIVNNKDQVVANLTGVLHYNNFTFVPSNAILASVISGGSKLRYDNSYYIAAHAYHRYQVPDAAEGYYVYDQYRFPNGTDMYPRRPVTIGPIMSSATTGGALFSGSIRAGAKMIFVSNLLDVNAYPWNVDWYLQRMRSSGIDLGAQARVYSQQHADHFDGRIGSFAARRVVRYDPYLWQALTDVANWVENGTEPPQSSQYTVDNAQIAVPNDPATRGGIQPVVTLTANSLKRVQVAAGQLVTFSAVAAVVPGTGSLVRLEWDFEGTGVYTTSDMTVAAQSLNVSSSHTYNSKGTYYAAVRVASNRDAKLNEEYVLNYNLDRVRVVVK